MAGDLAGNPKIRFDPTSSVPAIRQITGGLRVLLVNQDLNPGDSLPSVRRLAIELGVHFNTVAEAYRELAAEGWLDLRHGRGALVIARSVPNVPTKEWLDDFRAKIRNLIAQTRAGGASTDEIAAELREIAKVVVKA